MSRKLSWKLSNAKAGMHRIPSEVSRPEIYANIQSNLRQNDRGHLTTRPAHTVEQDVGAEITGLVAVENDDGTTVILFLDDQNRLRVLLGGIGGTESTLVTDANMTGRLSAVFVLNDVIFVTSEGTDRGYWVDLTSYPSSAAAYPIGFDKPTPAQNSGSDDGNTGNLDDSAHYYYAITYYRQDDPFREKESLLSNLISVDTLTDGGGDNRQVEITNLPTKVEADTGITHMRLWRSEGRGNPTPTGTATGGSNTTLENSAFDFENALNATEARIVLNTTDGSQGVITDIVEGVVIIGDGLSGGTDNLFQSGDSYEILPTLANLQLRRLDTIPITTSSYIDTISDTDLTASTRQTLDEVNIIRNDPPPASVSCVEWYRDRVFFTGYGTGSRFSDIRDGNPTYWAFPQSNEVLSHRGKIHVVTTLQSDILTFGGPDALGRLVGNSVYDFDIDWLERRGPIDPAGWISVSDTLFYLSPAGVFAFDGAQSVEVGRPISEIFTGDDSNPASVACMGFLPSNELVIDLIHVGGSTHTQLVLDLATGAWSENRNADAHQFIVVENTGVMEAYYAWANTNYIRRYWHGREPGPIPSGSDEITGPTSPTVSAIAWKYRTQRLDWESQGVGDERKLIRSVSILTDANESITMQEIVDGSSVGSQALTVSREVDRAYKIASDRRGYDYQLDLSGTGEVQIEAITIEAAV